jgi:hypothetical protein
MFAGIKDALTDPIGFSRAVRDAPPIMAGVHRRFDARQSYLIFAGHC